MFPVTTRPAAPQVRFGLLGPLEVRVGDGVQTPRAHKLRVLLAILLVRCNQIVPTDSLIYELWGDSPPRTSLKALRVYVSQLRRLSGVVASHSGHPALVACEPGYRFEMNDAVLDIWEFDRLCARANAARGRNMQELAVRCYRDALELCRGPALIDVRSAPFLQNTALRLEEARFAALERRIDLEIQLGRHIELIPELRGLADEYPLREGVHAQMMIAFYLAGRKNDALAVYRELRGTLVNELGIEPDRRLRLLHQAILADDDEVDETLARWMSFSAAYP